MHVGLKPLNARGEYLVALLEDGYPTQFAEKNPEGVWLFRVEDSHLLETYKRRLAVVEPQWPEHVEVQLYD